MAQQIGYDVILGGRGSAQWRNQYDIAIFSAAAGATHGATSKRRTPTTTKTTPTATTTAYPMVRPRATTKRLTMEATGWTSLARGAAPDYARHLGSWRLAGPARRVSCLAISVQWLHVYAVESISVDRCSKGGCGRPITPS
eukprot:9436983-Pyramimonas_sp.AAC.1